MNLLRLLGAVGTVKLGLVPVKDRLVHKTRVIMRQPLAAVASILCVAITSPAYAQLPELPVLVRYAGGGSLPVSSQGVPATSVNVSYLFGVGTDAVGNVYFGTFYTSNYVKRVAPDGLIYTVAGTGVNVIAGDGGLAIDASVRAPNDIVVDADGNLFMADLNGPVRRIDADTGRIASIAGTAAGQPYSLAVDADYLYIGGEYTFKITRIPLAELEPLNETAPTIVPATVDVIAGTGVNGNAYLGVGDLATDAQLRNARDVEVDAQGNVYFTDQSGLVNGIYRIDGATGILTLVYGNPASNSSPGPVEGASAVGTRCISNGIALDSNGTVYFDDNGIWKIDQDGKLRKVVDGGGFSGRQDLDFDAQGNIFTVIEEGIAKATLQLQPPDTTAPTASPSQDPAANSEGWNNTDVTVTWDWADAGGFVSTATNCPVSSDSSDEGNLTLTATCNDSANNTGNADYTVKVDKTKPTISAAATTLPNGTGWYATDVTVQFTCSDAGGSGIAPSGGCPPDETLSTEGAAVASTVADAADAAGNISDPSNVVTVKIDKTKPTLSPSVSPNPVLLNGAATATSGALDALSGLASSSCGVLDTSSIGAKTVACSATDNAGNTHSASASYSVNYAWTGFFQPVDSLPVLNSVKAGQAIPVKFSLAGNQGLNIMAMGYPMSTAVTCGSTATDDVEQTVTAGSSSLSYDPLSGQYTYVWKTDKAWANTCRTLTVKLIDGTVQQANFQFKK